MMYKALLTALVVLSLVACGDSSSDSPETETVPDPAPVEPISLETTAVAFHLNLPEDATVVDTQDFVIDDPLSYNASVSSMVCMPDGESLSLAAYFVKTADSQWDAYFTLDDDTLNIDGGVMGGSGFAKATLHFAEDGTFLRQTPYIITSSEITTPEKDFTIELDFYSFPNTTMDEAFNIKALDANGC